MQARHLSRMTVQCAVAFFGTRLKGTGVVKNLSEEGCALRTTTPLQAGTDLTLQIRLPENRGDVLVTQAKVRWEQDENFGIEFIQLTEEAKNVLTPFLAKSDLQSDPDQSVVCVRCNSPDVKRAHRNGLLEMIASLFYVYPFRCQECGIRFKTFQWGIRYLRK